MRYSALDSAHKNRLVGVLILCRITSGPICASCGLVTEAHWQDQSEQPSITVTHENREQVAGNTSPQPAIDYHHLLHLLRARERWHEPMTPHVFGCLWPLLDNVQAPCFDLIGRTHLGNDEG